ncbi:hypothetical protein DH86_00002673, partial [Scytalidium sp. 3C]
KGSGKSPTLQSDYVTSQNGEQFEIPERSESPKLTAQYLLQPGYAVTVSRGLAIWDAKGTLGTISASPTSRILMKD